MDEGGKKSSMTFRGMKNLSLFGLGIGIFLGLYVISSGILLLSVLEIQWLRSISVILIQHALVFVFLKRVNYSTQKTVIAMCIVYLSLFFCFILEMVEPTWGLWPYTISFGIMFLGVILTISLDLISYLDDLINPLSKWS